MIYLHFEWVFGTCHSVGNICTQVGANTSIQVELVWGFLFVWLVGLGADINIEVTNPCGISLRQQLVINLISLRPDELHSLS